MTDEEIKSCIAKNRWVPAETYKDFCPHEYTLIWTWESRIAFKEMVRFIWKNGVEVIYGKLEPKHYWFDFESGWYYFVSPFDVDGNGKAKADVILVNRARVKDFIFFEDMLNLRCKAKRRCDADQPIEEVIALVGKYSETEMEG